MSSAEDNYINKTNQALDSHVSKAISEARYLMYKNVFLVLLAVGLLLIVVAIIYHFIIKKPIIIEYIKVQKIEIPVEVERFIEIPVYIDRYVKKPVQKINRDKAIKYSKEKPFISSGNGTGFFINTKGDVLTNKHVVSNCSSIWVRNATRNIKAEVLTIGKDVDLAVVRTGYLVKTPAMFASNPVKTLNEVVAFGFPLLSQLGDEIKATKGHISALSGYKGNTEFLSHTASIQPGNSGGALLNTSGSVIGINTAKLTGNKIDNLNFAIKGTVAQQFINNLNIPIQYSTNTQSISSENMVDVGGKITVQILCSNSDSDALNLPIKKTIKKPLVDNKKYIDTYKKDSITINKVAKQNKQKELPNTTKRGIKLSNDGNLTKIKKFKLFFKNQKDKYGCQFVIRKYIINKTVPELYSFSHNWNTLSKFKIDKYVQSELGCKLK